jgi:hypothetical protein
MKHQKTAVRSYPDRENGNPMTKMILLIALALCLAGCADRVTFAAAALRAPVGFWYGLWHGMISPAAVIGHIFDPTIAIYAIYNNGGWYDFGFVLGATTAIGTGGRRIETVERFRLLVGLLSVMVFRKWLQGWIQKQ